LFKGVLHNLLTNQLVISQVVDWLTCRLVSLPTATFWKSQYY